MMDENQRAPGLSERDFLIAHEALSASGLPITKGLIGLFVGVYGISLWLSQIYTGRWSLDPNLGALITLGATSSTFVLEQKEWYRLLTAALLHGGPLHLAFNSYALYMVGRFLEPLLGKRWYFAFFAIGALGGSLLGMKINSPDIVSVGASGAIMALFAVLGICSFRIPEGRLRSALRIDAVQVLIPSLLPLGMSIGGGKIDYAAHLGGALAGVICGLGLIASWDKKEVRPKRHFLCNALCLLSGLAYLSAITEVIYRGGDETKKYKKVAAARDALLPDEQYKKLFKSGLEGIEAGLKTHPHDPRLLFMAGMYLVQEKKWSQSEIKLRAALEEKDILETYTFGAELTPRITYFLTLSLKQQGKQAEAATVSKDLCNGDKKRFSAAELKEICP